MRTRQGLVAMLGIGVALAVQAWVPGGVGPEVEARSAAPVVPLSLPKLRHVRAVPVADVPLEVVSAEPVDDLLMSRALHDDDAVLGVLHGHVVGPDGQPLAGVHVMARSESGALDAGRTDDAGRYRFALPVGRVRVAASRWDGLVEVRSDDVMVRVTEGSSHYLPLDLQAEAGADAGLVAVEHPDGFEVTWAVPGLAAYELGLTAGDRITAVDGRPATELTLEDLEQRLVGVEGSEVELTVLVDGQPTQLTVPRWGFEEQHMAAAAEGADSGAG